jgi:hypothetical protein
MRYHPWWHAEELRVTVVDRPWPVGSGATRSGAGAWPCDSPLCQFERRCTLAHELVHHERGDDCRL